MKPAALVAPALAVAVCLPLIGCRTYIPYVGRPMASHTQARKVIQRVLEQQPGGAAPIAIEVGDESIRLVRQRTLIAGHAPYATAVYYETIGDMRLSKKRNWYMVTIVGLNGEAVLYVYSADQASAQAFIDALATMRAALPAPGGDLIR